MALVSEYSRRSAKWGWKDSRDAVSSHIEKATGQLVEGGRWPKKEVQGLGAQGMSEDECIRAGRRWSSKGK